MNRQRLTELAEMLEGGRPMPEGFRFDMCSWLDETEEPECGTAGCIAGLAWLLHGHEASDDMLLNAIALLGLSESVARALFLPPDEDLEQGCWWKVDDITPTHAAQAIRHVLEHGEPRWAEVMGPEPA